MNGMKCAGQKPATNGNWNFNEETQEEELWVYDWNNMFLAESLEAFMADNEGEPPHGEHGDGYMVTKHGIFTDEIVHRLFDAETFDGENQSVSITLLYLGIRK